MLLIIVSIYFFPLQDIFQRTVPVFGQALGHLVEQRGYFLKLRFIAQIEPFAVIGIGDFLDAIRQFLDLYADRAWQVSQKEEGDHDTSNSYRPDPKERPFRRMDSHFILS